MNVVRVDAEVSQEAVGEVVDEEKMVFVVEFMDGVVEHGGGEAPALATSPGQPAATLDVSRVTVLCRTAVGHIARALAEVDDVVVVAPPGSASTS